MFYPITATPYKHNEMYSETLPGRSLAEYIRCFWGTEKPVQKRKHKPENVSKEIVIPDVCTDIIYTIDHTDNRVSGGFCGIDDESFWTCGEDDSDHLVSTFAIRFYAWKAYAFAEDSLKGTLNQMVDVGAHFSWIDRVLKERLLEVCGLSQRIEIAERLLLGYPGKNRTHPLFDSAMQDILLHKGNVPIHQLAADLFVSKRQLERIFAEYVGITPKKLSNLIRYQFLWNDILQNENFNMLDAVYAYGFSDQAHLHKEFRRYHAMGIREARAYALRDFR